MKPMIILRTGAMSAENMDLLRENGVCVVEADEPEEVTFVDPIPCVSNRTEIEGAAVALMRKLLDRSFSGDGTYISYGQIWKAYLDALRVGTPIGEADVPAMNPQKKKKSAALTA